MYNWNRPFTFAVGTLVLSLALSGCQSTESAADKKPHVPTDNAALKYKDRCQSTQASLNNAIDALEHTAPPHTTSSVLEPLNDIELLLGDSMSESSLYENVHPDAALRKEAQACTTALADIASRLGLSRNIYDAVSHVDVSQESADTRRYHSLTLRNFKLAGVDKDEKTRRRIRELNDTITQLGQAFDKNILEDVRYIEVSPDELTGLPQDFIDAKTLGDNGKIQLSTRYVDTIPVYTYAHSDEVRKQLRQLDRSRAYPQNATVLKQLLEARYELANLLGYNNFADYITANKMTGSAATAQNFIDQVHTLATPVAKMDMTTLLTKLQKLDPDATEVNRWQATYLEELIRREQYEVDASQVRQYFPYVRVRDGIFDLVSHMFGVEIRPWQTTTWHPSVEAYELYQDGVLIARFYLDMHPREGKYQHAAAFSTQIGIKDRQLPVSTLVCNFAGGDDPYEPMEFSEVRTFLHEFGHLLHAMFGGHQRWATMSGIATEWDFVEAPSQMLEEWMYDKDTLQSFAINREGEVIPDDLVERLNAARHFGEGLMTNVQMFYSALSLDYHRHDPATFNLLERLISLENHYSPMPHQDDTYFFANLGHLNGYSAIYYTYMWSKVIAMDMFSAFEKGGLRNSEIARHYRDTILAPGGSAPAAELVENFLGRPYSFEAFAENLKQPRQ